MLDEHIKITILRLYDAGYSTFAIARALRLSRSAVRRVLISSTSEVPEPARADVAQLLEPLDEEVDECSMSTSE